MPRTDALISLADLSAAGVRLRPHEAVTIVRELVLRVSRGELPGVPSAHVIRLSGSGTLRIEGPVAAGGGAVPRAAQLLESMLPGFDASPELRASGALRLVVARALGTLDLPPYPSLESLADALSRFAASDVSVVIAELVESWSAVVATQTDAADVGDAEPQFVAAVPVPTPAPTSAGDAEPLTISDIRRARRATGLTLQDIAGKSRIPAWLLRELEWGYFRNWPGGHYGRTQLIRYARAAGLDEQLVVSAAWPQLESNAVRAGTIIPAAEPQDPPEAGVGDARPWEVADVVLEPQPRALLAAPSAPVGRRRRILAALAIPAVLVLGVLTALEHWPANDGDGATRSAPVQVAGGTRQDAPASSAVKAAPEPDRREATRQDSGSAPGAAGPSARPGTANPSAQPADGIPDAVAYSPAFATTGSAMFYHAESNGQSTLMRADTDSGGAILRVTSIVDDHSRNFHARPSPDGSLIAFDSDREGERAVYVANADGTDVRRISGDGFAAVPSWSPDGRTLAYVRAEEGRPAVWNLWTTNLDSGATTRVTSHRVGQPWGASWFPDGRRLAYSHETRLVVRDLATGRERAYSSPVKGRLVRTPAVSPDGRRIIFQVRRDGTWLLDLSDGAMRKVLSDPSAEEYTWSPDGRRVAYHSRRSGSWGVWVMAAR